MRSELGSHHNLGRMGPGLVKSPGIRQEAARRRMLAVCGVLGLAIVSGVIGAIGRHDDAQTLGKPQTGPFSYFPSE